MRKLTALLLLFYAAPVYAQHFSIGAMGGEMAYKFRQQQPYSLGVTYYTYGLVGHYSFKDSSRFGIEATALYAPSGLNIATGYFDPLKGINAAGYLCYTPFPHLEAVLIQFRAGAFYTQYSTPNMQPTNDYGPSVGVFLGCFRITKKSYIGFDFSMNVGVQSYFIPNVLPYEAQFMTGTTNITYENFLIKYVIKI